MTVAVIGLRVSVVQCLSRVKRNKSAGMLMRPGKIEVEAIDVA